MTSTRTQQPSETSERVGNTSFLVNKRTCFLPFFADFTDPEMSPVQLLYLNRSYLLQNFEPHAHSKQCGYILARNNRKPQLHRRPL
jgi:hypothetical protein